MVLDNYFNFTEDKREWKDTKLIFEISGKGDQSEIDFTHRVWFPSTNASLSVPISEEPKSWNFWSLLHGKHRLLPRSKLRDAIGRLGNGC